MLHAQTRSFIRTALIFLVAAFFVDTLVLVNQGLVLDKRIRLLPELYVA
jgi:hypothetical protein